MQRDSFHVEVFFQKRLVQHICFWLFVVSYFTIGYTRNGNFRIELLRSAAFLPNHMFTVYTFFYLLIPLLFVRKFLLFFILAVVIYGLSMCFSWLINYQLLGENQTAWSFGASLLGQSTVLGMAISIKLLKYWYQQKKQIMEVQHQKMFAELELLKSQIHPHFLFNTLNNLYSHTLHQSEKAPEIVLKLSHLLRFMIYESNVSFIPLRKEISLLQQYIELEQLRYGDRLDVSVSVRGNTENKQIVPLLLLPLVENAFKHGVSRQLDQCWISLDMEVSGENFTVKLVNSKDGEERPEPANVGGLGLMNVRKRLDYLYHGRYKLEIFDEEEVFIVTLQLQLTEAKISVINEPSLIKQSDGTEMLIGG
jgi:sensor histidine kinase YesM